MILLNREANAYAVATALTVYGIETLHQSIYKNPQLEGCNSPYRLRY